MFVKFCLSGTKVYWYLEMNICLVFVIACGILSLAWNCLSSISSIRCLLLYSSTPILSVLQFVNLFTRSQRPCVLAPSCSCYSLENRWLLLHAIEYQLDSKVICNSNWLQYSFETQMVSETKYLFLFLLFLFLFDGKSNLTECVFFLYVGDSFQLKLSTV